MKSTTEVQTTTANQPKSGLNLIYTLDVLDWSMCIGGRHYTGHVCWQEIDSAGITQYNRHELNRRLTLSEAKELSEADGRLWLRHERITNRFETLTSIERAAIKWVEKNAKETDWLLQYNSQLNPEKTLAARGGGPSWTNWRKFGTGLRTRSEKTRTCTGLFTDYITN